METKLKSMFVAALTLTASTQKLGINLIRVAIRVDRRFEVLEL